MHIDIYIYTIMTRYALYHIVNWYKYTYKYTCTYGRRNRVGLGGLNPPVIVMEGF